jgi:hypothetical protein
MCRGCPAGLTFDRNVEVLMCVRGYIESLKSKVKVHGAFECDTENRIGYPHEQKVTKENPKEDCAEEL